MRPIGIGEIAPTPGLVARLVDDVTLPTSAHSQATIQALWRSRLGVAKLFSRAIGDYPDIAALLQRSETPNARALAATTITLSTSGALSPTAETAILSVLEEAGQYR